MTTKALNKRRMPTGLGSKGKRLWSDVTSQYILRPDELEVLEHACRQADLVEAFRKELANADLIVSGSKGQAAPHPLLQEIRASRDLVAKLLRQLGLPDGDVAAPSSRSTSARAAAEARWRKGS